MSTAEAIEPRRWTVEEFLAWQSEMDERYELVDGSPVKMMSPTLIRHDRIIMNLTVEIAPRLRGGPCEPFSGDNGIETIPGQIRRPDFGIDCGQTDDDSYLRSAPTLVAEVFSPSTKRFDLAAKLPEYQSVEGMKHILYIDPHKVEIAHWWRDVSEAWRVSWHMRMDDRVDLKTFSVTISVDALYRGIRLDD